MDEIMMEDTPRPKKKLGQNFLVNKDISRRIVNGIPLKDHDRLIEIGPGMGALTQEILKKDIDLTAIELDEDLVKYLKSKFKDHLDKDLELVHGDCIEYIRGFEGEIPYVVSNLPYNISTQLIGTLLDITDLRKESTRFQGATIMFQKEFAERLISPHGTKKYGRLSINFQLKMEYEEVMNVSRFNFKPVPKVDSMVISFKPRSAPFDHIEDIDLFNRIIDNSFGSRRKMLKNTLEPAGLSLDIPKEDLFGVLSAHGVLRSRPEELSISDFIHLTNDISVSNG